MVARPSVDLHSVDLPSVDRRSEAVDTDTPQAAVVVDTLQEDTHQAVVDTLQEDTEDTLQDLLSEAAAVDLSVEAVADLSEDTLQEDTHQEDSHQEDTHQEDSRLGAVDSEAAPTEFLRRTAPPHLHLRNTVLHLTVVHRSEAAAVDRSVAHRLSVAAAADPSVDPLSVAAAAAHSEVAAADSVPLHPATELPQCHKPFPRSTRPTVDTRKLIDCVVSQLNCERNRTSSRVNKSIL